MIKNGTKAILVGAAICTIGFMIFFYIQVNKPTLADHSKEIQSVALDLNSATEDELTEIPGIGAALARNIISYREEYGNYVDTDELLNIKGVSQELYEQISQYIILGGS